MSRPRRTTSLVSSPRIPTTKPFAEVRAYLDNLLRPASSSDQEGNGLVVEEPREVRRLGAALNTSFWAIEAAVAAQVDLLLVHHAPWRDIDLHLRRQKLTRLSEAGVGLYAAHDTLDRAKEIGIGRQCAELIEIEIDQTASGELIVGTPRTPDREVWLSHLAQKLNTPIRAWPNNPVFLGLPWVPLPEATGITGGGVAPMNYAGRI